MNNSPIIFLPGLGFKASLADYLGLENCLGVDLPIWDAKMSLNDVLKPLIDKIPIHAIIIGWSLGGLIALLLKQAFKEHIKDIILVNASPKYLAADNWAGVSLEEAKQFSHLIETDFIALIKGFTQRVQFPDKCRRRRKILNSHLNHDQVSFKKYTELLFNTDLRDGYLKQTVYQIISDNDIVWPEQVTKNVLLQSQPTYQIQGAGHAPFLSHQQQFTQIIKEIIHE
jgi:pimeloyl-[acyl-carrier protein] methyl ester esterase